MLIDAWMGIPSSMQLTALMDSIWLQVEEFYFQHYLTHWSEPVFSDALASIPAAMCWDDHDIFDGAPALSLSVADWGRESLPDAEM